MKAIVLPHYGSPADLRLADVPVPTPAPGEVLVRVHASTVNDLDWAWVRGRPFAYRLMFGLTRPRVAVLGAEIAGTVETVGPGASVFRPGDRVYGDVSQAGLGGFAEFARVREDALAAMPSEMSFEQAAALPHAAMLALQGLVDGGRLQPGERVLINGAGGGVGVIGVQIAKQYGATVAGVDRDFKLPMLTSIGYDRVGDYRRQDFTRAEHRYDVILDTRTTRSPLRYLRALAPGGRYVTVGGSLPRLLQTMTLGPLVAAATGKATRVVGLRPNRDLPYVNDLFVRRALRCVIDGPYPLRDVPLALARFGRAEHIGKVVILVAP
jgi:NADPH:quinone reductase-like Zn-dependent oxidoreductase